MKQPVLQVFRAWTQNTDELIQERPQKLLRLLLTQHFPGCRPQHVFNGSDLHSAAPLSAGFAQGGKWGSELEDLFANSIMPGSAQGIAEQLPSAGHCLCDVQEKATMKWCI